MIKTTPNLHARCTKLLSLAHGQTHTKTRYLHPSYHEQPADRAGLLYHGKERWKYKTLADLFDLEPALQVFVPDYQYIFHNLGEIPDEEIQALNNNFLAASLLAMKYSDLKQKLNALLPTILMLISETDKNLQNTLIVYTLVGNPLGREQFLELITSLPPFPNKESIMDTLEQFVEKGRKEGIAEGIELGKRAFQQEITYDAVKSLVKQSVLTDEQIASAMNVTINYVLQIRQDSKS